MPLISVIIPLFNKEHYIQKTLQSVFNQSYTNYEIIIVNDASTDASLDIVNNLKSNSPVYITIINKEKNQGLSNSRNLGIAQARGDVIALLDADDVWLPNHLTVIARLYAQFKNASLFGTGYTEHYAASQYVQPKVNYDKKSSGIIEDFFKTSLYQPLTCPSSFAFTKESFHTVKGFDPNITYGEDTDFYIRANRIFKMAFTPHITCVYTAQSENQITQTPLTTLQPPDYITYAQQAQSASETLYFNFKLYQLARKYRSENNLTAFQMHAMHIKRSLLTRKQNLLLTLPLPLVKALELFKEKALQKGVRFTSF